MLVGIETALADDPDLTVRLPGYDGRQPVRVVLDSRQRLSPQSRLARSAHEVPTWIVTLGGPNPALVALGVRVITVATGAQGRPDLKAVVARLAEENLTRLFVEGGGQVAASFLEADLVDQMEWFRAPLILGASGRPAIGGLSRDGLAQFPRLTRMEVAAVGDDLWERYQRL